MFCHSGIVMLDRIPSRRSSTRKRKIKRDEAYSYGDGSGVHEEEPPCYPPPGNPSSPPAVTAAVSRGAKLTATCVSHMTAKCLFLPCIDPLPMEICCDDTTTSMPENEGGGPSVSSK